MNEPQTPGAVPAAAPQKGLSITSLVLGILSLGCLYIFAGLPAIITGHIARRRAKRQPEIYGGAGMALAGLILGYLSILTTIALVAVLAAIILPAMAKAKGSFGQSSFCVNNLKQVGLAARIWSNDHNEKFPPDFLSMSNELVTPLVLICDGDKTKTAASDWTQFDPAQNASYEYLVPNAKEADVMAQPAFRCPIHGHVALGDGSVQQSGSKRKR
ncbi:MAG TPA: DUF4190 domain-containing protein [Candidatus Limnocylindria bacterium]|nr:DUF4190 domain-containing protein [Candidatus Limnocylindria bacterium]